MTVARWSAPYGGARGAAALAVLLLCGCGTTAQMAGLEGPAADWRVVERLGETRYRDPGTARWTTVTAGSRIPGGAEVTTSTGGRLIVAATAVQVSAGPDSSLILSDSPDGVDLSQAAGHVRYRLSGRPTATTSRVVTPHAELAAVDAVFDVVVDAGRTEVEVESGEMRIATTDGQREATLRPGQSAVARGHGGTALAVRDAPDLPYQGIEPVGLAMLPSASKSPSPAVVTAGDDARAAAPPAEPGPPADASSGASAAIGPPEPADDGDEMSAESAPASVDHVTMAPFGPPRANAGMAGASDSGTASPPWIAAWDGSPNPLPGLWLGSLEIPASFPQTEEVRPRTEEVLPAETVPPATTPEEAREIYARLANGMLDNLPSAGE